MSTEKNSGLTPGLAHILTVGSTASGASDVVSALIDDLKPAKPAHVTVLATADSQDNARRLLQGLKMTARTGRVVMIESAHSLDEVYRATQEALDAIFRAGFEPRQVILHYTAGTKVMSAGAVLAALNHDVQALRYLYSPSRTATSEPVMTTPSAVLGDRQLRLARTLMTELRFASCTEVLAAVDTSLLSAPQQEVCGLLRELAPAFASWDNFRVGEFLPRYEALSARLEKCENLRRFRVSDKVAQSLGRIVDVESRDGEYPEELLFDLINNGIRRLAERRPDDALIRFHRAAEIYAQSILKSAFSIRTDDLDIRKVPPRARMLFESERRLDDATIKLGLRKSYDLLEILGHPVGEAYRGHRTFRDVLDARRSLVLAHGTRPASTELAIDFLREILDIFKLTMKDVARRAAAQQFPWIDNARVLERLAKKPTGTESVLNVDEVQKKSKRAPAAPKKAGK